MNRRKQITQNRRIFSRRPCRTGSSYRAEVQLQKKRPGDGNGFHLLNLFLHELGHLHDRLTSRQKFCGRGEPYAEDYARRCETLICERYVRAFEI